MDHEREIQMDQDVSDMWHVGYVPRMDTRGL